MLCDYYAARHIDDDDDDGLWKEKSNWIWGMLLCPPDKAAPGFELGEGGGGEKRGKETNRDFSQVFENDTGWLN